MKKYFVDICVEGKKIASMYEIEIIRFFLLILPHHSSFLMKTSRSNLLFYDHSHRVISLGHLCEANWRVRRR